MDITDNGPEPNTFDIETATKENETYRTVAWTGRYLQVTLMSIPVGESIGLEVHPETDQFLRLEQGEAKVLMGPAKDKLTQEWQAADDWSIVVPAGTWHNIVNVGQTPLKLYSIYAPPHHAHGTVHRTQADATAAEEAEHEH